MLPNKYWWCFVACRINKYDVRAHGELKKRRNFCWTQKWSSKSLNSSPVQVLALALSCGTRIFYILPYRYSELRVPSFAKWPILPYTRKQWTRIYCWPTSSFLIIFDNNNNYHLVVVPVIVIDWKVRASTRSHLAQLSSLLVSSYLIRKSDHRR